MKIYFGDNQFLGVNHSQGLGSHYLDRYKDPQSIADTLKDAWEAGIKDFSFTVTPKTIQAIHLIIEDCPFNLHPSIPYAHAVNDLISEKGLLGAIKDKVVKAGVLSTVTSIFAAMFGNYTPVIGSLIRAELAGLPMSRVQSVGLLNVATDFLIGIDRFDILRQFDLAVQKMGVQTVFYTMNFERLAKGISNEGCKGCSIVFNLNQSGFRMNPSKKAVFESLKKYDYFETVAMSLFSGSQKEDLRKFLTSCPKIDGVLFGSSNKNNIVNSVKLFSDS
tara:strand:+ start:2004 stop:2831 length:828 start_codon:yes stop_codon:yes gene_type:complete